MAGLAVGFWQDKEEIAKQWQVEKTYNREMPAEQSEELYAGWQQAVESTRTFKQKTARKAPIA